MVNGLLTIRAKDKPSVSEAFDIVGVVCFG